ncbi:MAG: hypothetical protein IJS92_00830 [Paludibacteraceae bacterium]|nr:hypothetical protein [Paludibacteraceae bacterium]
MKTLRYIALIVLSGCAFCAAEAQQQSAFGSKAQLPSAIGSMSTVTCAMQSTSSYSAAAYSGQTVSPYAEAPAYVPSAAGDLDPFGASSASLAVRKAPPGTGGDKDNPSMEGDLADGTWFLLMLAALSAAVVSLRRQRALSVQLTQSSLTD